MGNKTQRLVDLLSPQFRVEHGAVFELDEEGTRYIFIGSLGRYTFAQFIADYTEGEGYIRTVHLKKEGEQS